MGLVANLPLSSDSVGNPGVSSLGAKSENPSQGPSGKSINRHIDFLDPIRGIAILLVFAYHSLGASYGRDQLPWGHWFRTFNVSPSFLLLIPATLGWAGVAIFFVVSGFCIHLSFSKSPQWRLFFWRRFFRIYPVYLVTLLFFAFVFPATRLHSVSLKSAEQLISHLFLFQNLGPWIFGINPSYWTISMEVQLYALYPLLIALVAWFGWRRSLIGIAAIEITLRLTMGILVMVGRGLPNYVGASPLVYWFSWSLGAYVAERHIRGTIFSVPKYSLYAIGAAAVAACFFKPLYMMAFLLFALLTAGVVATFLHEGKQQFPFPVAVRKHLQHVGIWSYSLYLWHQPLVAAVPRLVSKIAPGAHFRPVIIFGFCIVLWAFVVPMAWLSYKFCELPSISLGKPFYARAKKVQTTTRPLAALSE